MYIDECLKNAYIKTNLTTLQSFFFVKMLIGRPNDEK